jgi:hypothetical protein
VAAMEEEDSVKSRRELPPHPAGQCRSNGSCVFQAKAGRTWQFSRPAPHDLVQAAGRWPRGRVTSPALFSRPRWIIIEKKNSHL